MRARAFFRSRAPLDYFTLGRGGGHRLGKRVVYWPKLIEFSYVKGLANRLADNDEPRRRKSVFHAPLVQVDEPGQSGGVDIRYVG
jgi:hypothetical protein